MVKTKWSLRQFRGFNDFKFGSFTVYVTEKEIIIRGSLKNGNKHSPYVIAKKD